MAYFMWEHDDRNIDKRPQGRMLHELVQRRISNIPPPDHLFAGVEATETSIFHIPSTPKASRTSRDFAVEKKDSTSRSTSEILSNAKTQAVQTGGERGADLRALRTAVTDEWNQQPSGRRFV